MCCFFRQGDFRQGNSQTHFTWDPQSATAQSTSVAERAAEQRLIPPSPEDQTINLLADLVVRTNRADASDWRTFEWARNPQSTFLSHTSITLNVCAPNVCCEDIFNDENAQRPPQFNGRPRKLVKTKQKEGRERRKKKRGILDGPGQGCPGQGCPGLSGAGCARRMGVQDKGVQGRGVWGTGVRWGSLVGGPVLGVWGKGVQRRGNTKQATHTTHNNTTITSTTQQQHNNTTKQQQHIKNTTATHTQQQQKTTHNPQQNNTQKQRNKTTQQDNTTTNNQQPTHNNQQPQNQPTNHARTHQPNQPTNQPTNQPQLRDFLSVAQGRVFSSGRKSFYESRKRKGFASRAPRSWVSAQL